MKERTQIHQELREVEIRNQATSHSGQAPKHGGQFAQAMVKNYSKLPEDLQKVARSSFSKFSHQAMADLQESGITVRFVKPQEGEGAGGRYIDRGEVIEIYVDPKDRHAEAYLIHELIHAADRLKFRKENSPLKRALTTSLRDTFSSRQDNELRKLHLDYAKRTLPSVGQKMADFIAGQDSMEEKPLLAGARSYDWSIKGDTLELKERNKFMSTFQALHPSLNMGIVGTALGVTAAALGIGAAAPLIGGAVALPLLIFGGKNLVSSFRAYQDERALVGFESDKVKVTDDGMSIKLNQTLGPEEISTTAYATLNRQPEEYLAESMTEFMRTEESRSSLKERDPLMYEYCKNWNIYA